MSEVNLSDDSEDSGLVSDLDSFNISDFFTSLPSDVTGTGSFADILKGLGSVFAGTSSLGKAGQLTGLLGVAALANKMFGSSGGGGFAGYSGKIPTYTATRTMNTIPTTMANPLAGQTGQPAMIPRRPGSGGVTYFSPMVYTPVSTNTGGSGNDTVSGGGGNDTVTGASGGIMSLRNGHLGSYSDGGQLLRGPGDGVSDDIPATIADKQPARLADGEFVIPARIVSELGNGSTEAGARKLYAMMDRIKNARRKAKDIAADTKTDRYLPR
ncbi:MAG: hypothetical protein EBS53_11110 [Bacteroidetes bacterium]|nr:hypothetical protein [Bacteroidota bacterium]